jgi:UDP-N-acetyl-D-mannosaminuronic acid dehydrogenase
MHEFHTLPKIVAGINQESTEKATKVIKRLGGKVSSVSCPRVAEMCKLLDNLYRATNIAFANEVGELCEKAGINAEEVVSTVNSGYLRTMIYRPGLGADGPCLSKDPKIYKYSASRYNAKVPLAEGSITQNQSSETKITNLIKDFNLSNNPEPLNIAIIGAAFKGIPETDDTRDSTGEKVIKALRRSGVQINSLKAFDPRAKSFLDYPTTKSMEEAIQDANVIMFLTNHPRIMNLEFSHIIDKIKKPAFIIDAWGNINVESVPEGIHYYRIGHGSGFPRENQSSGNENISSLSKETSNL